jgi:hypothetical protein
MESLDSVAFGFLENETGRLLRIDNDKAASVRLDTLNGQCRYLRISPAWRFTTVMDMNSFQVAK